jgi:hypothetical protein
MLMKVTKFLSIIASALLLSVSFTSCEELEGLLNDDEKESSVDGAFFPDSYSQRKVAAWYSLTEEEKGGGKRIESVFLFDDNSFVATKNRIYTDGRSNERTIMAEGDYSIIEGDYTNGKAQVAVNGESAPMLVIITDGVMSAMGEEFVKQDNKKVPKASSATGEGGQGGQGGQGGDNNGIEAFFPNGCSSKDVASWYSQSGSISEQGYEMQYNAAIFFFGNGQFVATVHSVITGPEGPIPTKAIAIKGRYEWVEGNFETGKLKLIGDDGKVIVVDIAEGKLTGIESEDGQVTIYSKQDNKSVPQSSDPTENGQQGGEGEGGEGEGGEGQGGEGQGGEDQGNEVSAFFPKAYAEKTVVAWYSFSEGEKGETRVEAVFLFENDVVIVTENKVFAEELGMGPERYIKSVGSYKLRDGDYETGLGIVELSELGQHQVKIEKGVLTVDGLYGEYIKRALADIPDPLDPTDQGQQGGEGEGQGGEGEGQGGEGQGGEGQGGEGGEVQYNGDPAPYLPAQYAEKTIAAWYQSENVGNGTVRYECVFLFTDGSLVVTKSKFYNIGDGRGPEYGINATGQYRMSEGGDFENGTASVVTADGMIMEVSIQDGILSAMNTEFEIQDNDDAPAPLKL